MKYRTCGNRPGDTCTILCLSTPLLASPRLSAVFPEPEGTVLCPGTLTTYPAEYTPNWAPWILVCTGPPTLLSHHLTVFPHQLLYPSRILRRLPAPKLVLLYAHARCSMLFALGPGSSSASRAIAIAIEHEYRHTLIVWSSPGVPLRPRPRPRPPTSSEARDTWTVLRYMLGTWSRYLQLPEH